MTSSPAIDAFPRPQPLRLRRSAALARFVASFDARFPSGTGALFWALRGLDPSIPRVVWVPAYNCGVEVQAALDAGYRVRTFRVHTDMQADVGEIERGLRHDPGVVVLIHYFGFSQPARAAVAASCAAAGVPLIEDCAHALLPFGCATPGELVGVAGTFSLRKFLPVLDGGALRIVAPDLFGQMPVLAPKAGVFRAAVRTSLKSVVGERLVSRLRRRRSPEAASAPEPAWSVQRTEYECGMSRISTQMIGDVPVELIATRRREHYQRLARHLEVLGVAPHGRALGQRDVPLVLPIVVTARDSLLMHLAEFGVRPYVFGEFSHPATPRGVHVEVDALRDSIVGLPVHQELDAARIDHLADILSRVLPGHVRS